MGRARAPVQQLGIVLKSSNHSQSAAANRRLEQLNRGRQSTAAPEKDRNVQGEPNGGQAGWASVHLYNFIVGSAVAENEDRAIQQREGCSSKARVRTTPSHNQQFLFWYCFPLFSHPQLLVTQLGVLSAHPYLHDLAFRGQISCTQ